MKKYAIFGAGGQGREVIPLLKQQLIQSGSDDWDLVFVDDNPLLKKLNGYRVLTYSQWLSEPATSRHISLVIASSSIRETLAERCIKDGVEFVEVRASNVIAMDCVDIAPGAVLSPFVTLTSNIKIGRHFHANLYSYIAHDCIIGDFVTFAPGVHCNGNVVIEDHAYIGTSAVIRNGKPGEPLVIGRSAVVGMGAVVTKSVAPGSTVAGNPAKQFKV